MKIFVGLATGFVIILGAMIIYNATPSGEASLALPSPLRAFDPSKFDESAARADFVPLHSGFRPQTYRSYCGPASIATVLGAYGARTASQRDLFASNDGSIKAFFTGMTLAELAALARQHALDVEVRYADSLTVEDFRALVKENLEDEGDYLIINYDRRVLNQSGAGHISPLGAYDSSADAVLVLDQASYKYPYTWVPLPLLYESMATKDGDRYRGILVVNSIAQ